jgi:SpoVK/Ycf46/Vps4 family AAA+-type ATPase
MANPFRELFFGAAARDLVDAHVPRRTFADVVLPPSTRQALDHALAQIHKHDVIFGDWGLGERHATGLSLAFNFAGPPGTGKTICAEAVAHALGKKLLVVRYAELESQWAGATAKNVAAVFDSAASQDAVLFFDEADAIAGRRFTSMDQGYQREANAVVNVLLRELEAFPGVVIFATNLAANLDPAFERRIRTHILFEAPGPGERERIWQVQLHDRKTPLADDVDFAALARAYPATGGDIKNAVLKAAQIAVSEPGADDGKRIAHHHFETAILDVLASRRVMDQSLFAGAEGAEGWLAGAGAGDDEGAAILQRLAAVEDEVTPLTETVRALEGVETRLAEGIERLRAELESARERTQRMEETWRNRWRAVAAAAALAGVLALVALLG